jgi:TPR repeat protein
MGSTNVISAANVAHIKSLKVDAARGSAYAQYTLGVCYLNGSDGVPQSMERAKMMLELSAAQGNPGAVDRLDELKREETNTPPVVK